MAAAELTVRLTGLTVFIALALVACTSGTDDPGATLPADSAVTDTGSAGDADGDGFTVEEGDCDDADASAWPGASEIAYDGVDQDCDGADLTDADGDGHDAESAGGLDCDDADPARSPDTPELCDGVDDNCSGAADDEFNTVSFEARGGQWTSLNDALSGAMGAPAHLTLSEPGTLWFCGGQWSVSLTLAADIDVVGVDGVYSELSGGRAATVVRVSPGADVQLSGLTLRDGLATERVTIGDSDRRKDSHIAGGGLLVEEASIALTRVDIVDNEGAVGGGVMLHDATASFEQVLISGNGAGFGGGLFSNASDVTLLETHFIANTSSQDGGGFYVLGGAVDGEGLQLIANESGYGGGGLVEDAVLTLLDSDFTANAAESGGGLFLYLSELSGSGVTFADNEASYGGGLYKQSSDATLDASAFVGNRASQGGGFIISSDGGLSLSGATIQENAATYGGGGLLYSTGDVTVEGSLLEGNEAAEGAGVYVYYSDLSVRDTAFTGNTAALAGGGLVIDASTLQVDRCDFADNLTDDTYEFTTEDSDVWGRDASFTCDMTGCDE